MDAIKSDMILRKGAKITAARVLYCRRILPACLVLRGVLSHRAAYCRRAPHPDTRPQPPQAPSA